jgi:hypothetical protein
MEIDTMDKYIIGENSSGKTRKLLEEAKKNGAIVVCKNPYSMESKANCYEIFGLKFVKYEELDSKIVNGKKIAVDEIGEFFEHCYGAELDSFTMTID